MHLRIEVKDLHKYSFYMYLSLKVISLEKPVIGFGMKAGLEMSPIAQLGKTKGHSYLRHINLT